MLRNLLSWVAPFFLAGIFCLPVAAQDPNAPEKERRPPAPEYALAVLGTFLLLVIVCMPSRKS